MRLDPSSNPVRVSDCWSARAGVTPEDVEILEVRSGSVVVTFLIRAADAAVAATAVSEFAELEESGGDSVVIAGVAMASFGVVAPDSGVDGDQCDAEALTAVLDCAPERWDGFPFNRPGVGGATTQLVSDDGPECRRTALQSYLDDYKQCYEDHGCGERYPLFCEWKVSEWEVQCADPRIGASTVEGEPPTMCKEHTVREIEVSTAAVRFRSPSFGCALSVAIGSERVTVAMRAGDSVVGWRARCVHLVLRVPAGGSVRQVRRNGLPPSLRLCSLHRLMLLRCAGATTRSSG